MVNEKGVIIDRREMLRIKLKSLVAEVRIIQTEERRMPQALAAEMRLHRRTVIRDASRDTHLALGFLRGRSYGQLEAIHHTDPHWDRVAAMVKKYGGFATAMEMAVADALVEYWRANPTWKAPSLSELEKERRLLTRDKRLDERLRDFLFAQSKITLMSVAQSKMAA